MANVVLGIIGEDKDASEVLFKGFKKFPPQKVLLLVKKGNEKRAKSIEKGLDKFSIDHENFEVSSFLHLEEVFKHVREFSQKYPKDNLVINVDTDYMSSCLALSSAFVNGIVALGILKEEIIVYPVMKFSYYNAINNKKFELLKIIFKQNNIESMEKLSKLSKMSLPLIAYHLKGNRDSKGLIDMNLVSTSREKGSICISLTPLGRLIVSGQVDYNCPNC